MEVMLERTGNRKIAEKIRFLCDADKRTKFAGAQRSAAIWTIGEVQRWTVDATRKGLRERRHRVGTGTSRMLHEK